jgi:negative regulator of flagellin synthesis FlgM
MKIDRIAMLSREILSAANHLNQAEKKTSGSEADSIAVSDKAQVYQVLLQKVNEIPSVREERVKALAKQIERGEFKIDGQKIAEKLFSSGLE